MHDRVRSESLHPSEAGDAWVAPHFDHAARHVRVAREPRLEDRANGLGGTRIDSDLDQRPVGLRGDEVRLLTVEPGHGQSVGSEPYTAGPRPRPRISRMHEDQRDTREPAENQEVPREYSPPKLDKLGSFEELTGFGPNTNVDAEGAS